MDLTKDQRTLLLYLETCAVDHAGRVNGQHMNDDDFKQAAEWDRDGFVRFGRVASECITDHGGHWVEFTDESWAAAHAERRARADRIRARRTYRTTAEKRDGVPVPCSA